MPMRFPRCLPAAAPVVLRCVLGIVAFAVATNSLAAKPAISPEMETTARMLMARALEDNAGYRIVESLTTEIGPRLAGTDAEARARDWAVRLLSRSGFDEVRVEPFEVPLWLRGIERAEILSPFPQPLAVTALGGSVGTGPGGVEGKVVRFASLAELAELPPGSQQGAILFIDEVMARSRDGSGYGRAVAMRREAAYRGEELGAAAVLIRSLGTSSHRFAHTGQMRRVGSGGPSGVPAAALSVPDAQQLRRALERAGEVRVRLVLTPELRPPAPSGNVIAEITGREAPQEIVLVGAHLDSWDLGTGAVDDGAGVGIVVAAAMALIEHLPRPPRRTIRIVLFGAEEVGIVGARDYARRHAQALSSHVVATESDFGAGDIWRFDTGVGDAGMPTALAIGAILEELGIARGEPTARGGPDITPLREAGVPVVGLYQDGSDYFDVHHTPDDTLERIAPGALDQNVAAYAAFMYLAAETRAYFR